jgi:hypothetical protein
MVLLKLSTDCGLSSLHRDSARRFFSLGIRRCIRDSLVWSHGCYAYPHHVEYLWYHSINYLVDSYGELSNDAMSTIMLVRITISFAMEYG